MPHPTPQDVDVITARNLQVGDFVYFGSGWLEGPEEHNGCFRMVTVISTDPDRDLHAQFQTFSGEDLAWHQYYDYHTLVMVRKDNPNRK